MRIFFWTTKNGPKKVRSMLIHIKNPPIMLTDAKEFLFFLF
jgi:hypothetical protein